MVAYQHPRVNPPAMTSANLAQPEHEGFPIIVGLKHRLAAVAPRLA